MEEKKLIRVFLAHTSDVSAEKAQAERAVARVNPRIEYLRYEFRFDVWEKIGPKWGHAQETINTDLVEKCDIFVGVLWRRWGRPSGQYSSCFDWEFSLAEDRWKKSSGLMPEIWLYFRERGELASDRPVRGRKQLEQVIRFEKKICAEQRGLIARYKSPRRFGGLFEQMLHKYVGERVQQELSSPARSGQATKAAGQDTSQAVPTQTGSPERRTSASEKQIKELLESVAKSVSNLSKIDQQKARRLYLLAASLLDRNEFSDELGVHQVQALYREREGLRLAPRELSLLTRALLADRYTNKVGWFWVRHLSSRQIHDYLLSLCENEPDDDVRTACVKLLNSVWSKRVEGVVCRLLPELPKNARLAGLSTLAEVGSEECLSVLEGLSEGDDPQIVAAARKSTFAILLRHTRSRAGSFVAKLDTDEIAPLLSEVETAIEKLGVASLRRLREHPDGLVKQLATRELAKRGHLDKAELRQLADSDDGEDRYVAYSALIRQGETFDPEEVRDNWPKASAHVLQVLGSHGWCDDAVMRVMEALPTAEVRRHVTWLGPSNWLAYLVLGLRDWVSMSTTVRNDLVSGFVRIREEFVRGELADLMADGRRIEQRVAELDEFITSQFTVAALRILLRRGHKKDLRFAKKYLTSESPDIKRSAQELLVKLAGKDEIASLVQIALNDTGEVAVMAGRRALSLDRQRQVRDRLLRSDNELVVKLCLQRALERREAVPDDEVAYLLQHEKVVIRVMAVAYLVEASAAQRQKLEKIIKQYTHNESYYYNVVCWLDCVVYAPQTFRRAFRKKLVAQLA